MQNPVGPDLESLRNEVIRQKLMAKSAGKSTYFLEGDILFEELPDGKQLQTKSPDNLPCVTKLPKSRKI